MDMNPKINNAHDKFFKYFFNMYAVCKSFIEEYLGERTGYRFNVDSIECIQNSSVDSCYSEFFSDFIVRVEVLPSKIPVYFLFEHKSFPDPDIGNQLDNYMHVVRSNYSSMHPDLQWINIIPVALYHGAQCWDTPGSTAQFYQSLDHNEKYTPDFHYELFDISRMPDEQIRGTPLLRIVLFTMKYIHFPQLLIKIDMILVIFREISQESEISMILNIFIRYLESAALPEIRAELAEKIIAWLRDGDVKMSRIIDEITKDAVSKAALKAKVEGKVEGRVEGKVEDAQKMLQKGISVELVKEITGLTSKQLEELQRKMEGNDT